jgi:phosphonate transport system substrate-binding protein
MRFFKPNILFLFLAFLTACAPRESTTTISINGNPIQGEVHWPVPTDKQNVYVFGFDRRLEPKEDVRIYASLLEQLERETGYDFALHVTPKDGNLVREIGDGLVDFAVVGTLTYLQAHELYGARMLVRGVNEENESVYRAAIVTRIDSEIKVLKDLNGRSFAFGASSSTQGHLIPRLMMEQAGIDISDLRSYDYTGSHAETANAVISGRADAGGMQDTLAQTLADRGLLRIIAWSDSYPSSGVLAGAQAPTEVVEAVTAALLAFDPAGQDSAGLYHWERTEMPNGFSLAEDSDYIELHRWAEKYGLLTP